MATVTIPVIAEEPSPILPGDSLYEVIDGRVTELPPMGTYPVEVATRLSAALDLFARGHGIGRILNEALYRIDARNQKRPDVSFITYEKWPKARRTPKAQPWQMVPDLAIEVVSETDRAGDVLGKVRDYFRAGVRVVWLVYPDLEVIHLFDSFQQIRVLTVGDDLDGGALIPGFRLPLAELFEGEAEEEAGPAA